MQWQIDPQDARPPFDQLRVQILDDIRGGRLPAGSRLPTVRDLAARLGLAANTVARTYRELESAGIIETRGRGGTLVRAEAGSIEADAVRHARAYLEQMAALGYGRDAAVRYLGDAAP